MNTRAGALGLAILTLFACDDAAPPSDASLVCATAEQCDDGVFCNGPEACEPTSPVANALGCVAGVASCLEGQRCDESADVCEALCDVTTDADGDGAEAIACGGDDCDDSDAERFPGNLEICDADGHDEDCDPATVGNRDVDADGYIDAACCNGDSCGQDCADRMATVNPGAAEVCDLVDQDCDGNIDEGVQSAGFEDRDGDRHGDPDRARMACAFDGDVTPSMADCDDADGTRHGQMLEICDGVDNDCDGATDEARFSVSWYADTDGDGFGDPGGEVRVSCEPIEGFSTLPFDCDDTDGARSPIAPELCNALDDDCDGRQDFVLAPGDTEDDDGDGAADVNCPGGAGTDCDDRDPFAKPGVPELCDGVDNDCDGTVDEGAEPVYWYVDDDRDGYGDDAAERRASCERVPGLVLEGGDCDDGDGDVRPGARERCNGVDDDCDGTVDEDAGFVATYADDDGDGFGRGMPLAQCAVAGLRTLTPGDCDDGNPGIFPGAGELCNRVDDDCDGTLDEDAAAADWYPDADGDGYGDAAGAATTSCEPIPGASIVATDCADDDPNRFPGALELCDLVDQDCDGTVDEEAGDLAQYPDGDGDGYGAGEPTLSCDPIAGHVTRAGDCDDTSAVARPGAIESCNGVDDDCDGTLDEAPAGVLDCPLDSQNATPVCTDGVCGYGECLSGYDDCDGTTANGCETDLATDPLHCGACGASCGLADTCTAGSCDFLPTEAVVTSASSACALRNGQVYCWGWEGSGDHGNGPEYTGYAYQPRHPVRDLTDAVQLVGGQSFFCALRATGATVCWGYNGVGQLGNGTTDSADVPVPIAGGHTFAELSAYWNNACGRKASGAVFCWGTYFGAPNVLEPTEITMADGSSAQAAQLGVGSDARCIVDAAGQVFCQGTSQLSEALGLPGVSTNATFTDPVPDVPPAAKVVGGGGFTCALTTAGEVWCWGRGSNGQLGNGDLTTRVDALPVTGLSDAVDLSLGAGHACAIRSTGSMVCWGLNDRLQMGDPTFTDTPVTTPRPIPTLSDVRSVGPYHSTGSGYIGAVCAVEGAGVMCWSYGGQGRTGDGDTRSFNRAPPVEVLGFPTGP